MTEATAATIATVLARSPAMAEISILSLNFWDAHGHVHYSW